MSERIRRATAVLPAGCWPVEEAVATCTLAFEDRHRRRLRLTDDAGGPFLLDLPAAVALADGDGLRVEGGGVVRVRASPEAVVDITANPTELVRLAWHVGNRHVPVQVLEGGGFRIRDDRVLVDMLTGLGATATRHRAPFSPERGAYARGRHGHDAER